MVVRVRRRVIVPMMRLLCRSVIVVAAMSVGVRIVHVVDMTGRRHRRRFGFRSDLAQGMQEAAPFYPEEPHARPA